jgi:hypothetical protein
MITTTTTTAAAAAEAIPTIRRSTTHFSLKLHSHHVTPQSFSSFKKKNKPDPLNSANLKTHP